MRARRVIGKVRTNCGLTSGMADKMIVDLVAENIGIQLLSTDRLTHHDLQ